MGMCEFLSAYYVTSTPASDRLGIGEHVNIPLDGFKFRSRGGGGVGGGGLLYYSEDTTTNGYLIRLDGVSVIRAGPRFGG